MAKTNKELLADLSSEASEIRKDTSSVNPGLVKKGEVKTQPDTDEDEDEQDIEKSESEPDEESEEKSSPEEEEEESEEELEDEVAEKPQLKRGNTENALRRLLARKDEEIAELTGKFETLESAKTQEKQKEASDEIREMVAEMNKGRKPEQQVDPEAIEKMLMKAADIAERRIAGKLPPVDLVSKFEKQEEEEYFNSEWNDPLFQGFIEENYPKASRRQLEQAKILLDELAHDPETGGRTVKGRDGKERLEGFPLKYIMWEHQERFNEILSSKKRHGLESANAAGLDETEDTPDTSSSKGVDALDKKYRNLETSGLRRGRSQRDRGDV